MSDRKRGLVGRLWRGVDVTRRFVVNLLFLAVVVAAAVLLVQGRGPDVPESAALVLAPEGTIVEQLGGDPVERARNELTGTAEPQTLLRDLLDAIEAAATDDRIQVLFLDLDRMGGAGLTKLQDLGAAIRDFKTSGKRVIAAADMYGQNQYYLASLADEIYLHREGALLLEGYGRYRTYYRDLIDRLEIDWNVFRVGTFKSAVEPYLRRDMSEAARTANLEWLGDLWRTWLADVAAARGVPVEVLEDYVVRFPVHLAEAGGDLAETAVAAGLVDVAATRDAVRDRLVELVGEDEESHSFFRVSHEDYLKALGGDRPGVDPDGDGVGVIVARGSILDGTQPPGKIGGDSTAALIRQARHDDDVKALVLRVDSGGGSAFASEVIRRELELLREAGKPLVVSMGSVAASGGYWIATPADEIWAYPTTITGSIGIFGMLPTFQRPLEKHLGIRVDGVGTTWAAGAMRLDRALPVEVKESMQLVIEQGYRDFIGLVAAARGSTPEAVDGIAQGRVWSGEDAHRLGLVDQLGGFDQAVAAAARLADLGDDYAVHWVTRELDLGQRLMVGLFETSAGLLGSTDTRAVEPGPHLRLLRRLETQLEQLTELNDPKGVYALCLIEVE